MRAITGLLGLLAVLGVLSVAASAAEPVAPQAPALSATAVSVTAPVPVPMPVPAPAASEPSKKPAPARLSAKGRFLYANDDDWDWASPKGKPTTNLNTAYGDMEWSALDWIEEGLSEVRGLVLGTLPVEQFEPAEDLDCARERPDQGTYKVEAPIAGSLVKHLGAGGPGNAAAPNVVLMMRNSADDPPVQLSPEDIEALAAFVARGGRLIVLDDWGCYRTVLNRFLSGRPGGKPAAAGPSEALRARVAELTRQLGDDQWGARENATRDLLDMGDEVLPLIRAAGSSDPEVRLRLEVVATELVGAAAAAAAAAETQPLSNEALDRALPVAKKVGSACEMRNIARNDNQEGRALLLEVALPEPPKPGTVASAAKP